MEWIRFLPLKYWLKQSSTIYKCLQSNKTSIWFFFFFCISLKHSFFYKCFLTVLHSQSLQSFFDLIGHIFGPPMQQLQPILSALWWKWMQNIWAGSELAATQYFHCQELFKHLFQSVILTNLQRIIIWFCSSIIQCSDLGAVKCYHV